MEKQPTQGEGYTIRLARNFIYASYKEAGHEYSIESFEDSRINAEFGELHSKKNGGLFRYLDECICLVNSIKYAIFFSVINEEYKKFKPLVILIDQIKSNLIAIRVTGRYGLDDQARIILRALYENCVAICRASIDDEFLSGFASIKSLEDANQFWHKNIAKGKSEKYIRENTGAKMTPCFVIDDNTFGEMYRILGISAHPNYIISSNTFRMKWEDVGSHDKISGTAEILTEFTLVNSCLLCLSTLNFIGQNSSRIGGSARTYIGENPTHILSRAGTSDAAIASIAKIGTLMMFLLMKWVNRQKSNFDAAIHL